MVGLLLLAFDDSEVDALLKVVYPKVDVFGPNVRHLL